MIDIAGIIRVACVCVANSRVQLTYPLTGRGWVGNNDPFDLALSLTPLWQVRSDPKVNTHVVANASGGEAQPSPLNQF